MSTITTYNLILYSFLKLVIIATFHILTYSLFMIILPYKVNFVLEFEITSHNLQI